MTDHPIPEVCEHGDLRAACLDCLNETPAGADRDVKRVAIDAILSIAVALLLAIEGNVWLLFGWATLLAVAVATADRLVYWQRSVLDHYRTQGDETA